MEQQDIQMATVYGGGGDLKQRTREILLKEAESFRGDIKYLGLPASELRFERQLVKVGDSITMEGWDFSGEVVRTAQMKAHEEEIPLMVRCGDIHEATGEYNFSWFDYCGCLDPNKIQGLSEHIRKNLYHNGKDDPLIAITLLGGRESRKLWEFFGEKPPVKQREIPVYAKAIHPGDHRARASFIRRSEKIQADKWKRMREVLFLERLNGVCAEQGRHFEVQRYIKYMETSPMVLIIGRVRDGVRRVNSFEVEKLKERKRKSRYDWDSVDLFGMSMSEISTALGCSRPAVQYQRRKARQGGRA